nr:MAG TPA: hypothetical protein [Caudoviricetes sp.]
MSTLFINFFDIFLNFTAHYCVFLRIKNTQLNAGRKLGYEPRGKPCFIILL